ncbi:MAG: hypothetical protein JWO57_547 [Pseudonocardiales bacterium]|nr:hypothetical protein [Pseudonocardiales bacterium]
MAGVSRTLGLVALVVAMAGAAACASRTTHRAPAGAGSLTASSSSAPGVVIKTFSPYAATGTLVVPVADHLTGSCWTGSIAVPKAGVYRCLVGNAIYDPCFTPARQQTPPTVACLADPWSSAHIVRLSQPLPASTPATTSDYPWALELANHAHCVAATGTVPVVAGVSLNYLCGAGMGAGIVRSEPTRMQVKYGLATGSQLMSVAVAVAWRG